MKAKILIVEDDPHILLGLEEVLKSDGFEVATCSRGDQAVEAAGKHRPALIVLDVMLPGKSGYDICKELRGRKVSTPILMLTAKGQEIDKVVGLDLGADDYVCKPFSARELVARVKAILRRPRNKAAAGLILHEAEHRAELDGRAIDLTPVEFRLLAALASAPGRVFPRDKLLERLYADHRVVTDRTVDTHVKNLRRKLEEVRPGEDLVRSIYGVGYKLEL